MRAADTNVLVRLFTRDDAKQADAADEFVRNCAHNREPVFVSVPVICELVWVLDRNYNQSRSQIADILAGLLTRQIFRVDQEDLIQQALDSYRTGKANFSDYLIGAIAEDAGCRDAVSFDRDLKGAPGFTML